MSDLLVFTDLDGTLLDHHDYSYAAALPALQRLASAECPVIINSSKTAAEIKQLRKELGNNHPFIVENGSAVYIPVGYFNKSDTSKVQCSEEYDIHSFSPTYKDLIDQLHQLRSQKGYRFRGFHDLCCEDVAKLTGLSLVNATKALQRTASEPLIWEDSEDALAKFRDDLVVLKLSLTKGGRFYHVMGQTDKAQALQWLTHQYHSTWPNRQWTTVALGDGANDQSMLEVADIAVTIPAADGNALKLTRTNNVICPGLSGPHGWQIAIDNIFNKVSNKGV